MDRGANRKVRIDKKIDVKPTLNIGLKDVIYRLSYVTRTPVKMVGEGLCVLAFHSNDVMVKLAPYFQRNFKVGKTLYIGYSDNKQMVKRLPGHNEKITIRFKRHDFNYIYDLSYALGVTTSRMVAILIELAMNNETLINEYINKYVEDKMTNGQLKELEQIKNSYVK